MKKEMLEHLLDGMDDGLLEEVAARDLSNEMKKAKTEGTKRRRLRRTWLIAAAAALILAVTLPIIIFFANKAPEPETLVVAVTTEETKEEAKTPVTETPVVTPTQKETEIQPTETRVEPTPTETPVVTPTPTETPIVTPTPVETETPIVTPTPTETPVATITPTIVTTQNTTPDEPSVITFYSTENFWLTEIENPFIMIRITGISNASPKLNQSVLSKKPQKELKYELLCASGEKKNPEYQFSMSEVMETVPPLCVNEDLVSGLTVGDIVEMEVGVLFYDPGTWEVTGPKFLVFCYDVSFAESTRTVFEESKLVINDEHPYCGRFNDYKKVLKKFKTLYDQGYSFVNKELFDRMPNVEIGNGTTVDELIAVVEWFDELRKVMIIKAPPADQPNGLNVIV